MEPEVILVDLQNNPLGILGKAGAHKMPRLHRAFSVFLYHGDQVLIQQRARHKYHSGGLWANTCCSHPRPGEVLEDCVKQRLWEETGVAHNNLRWHHDFIYFAKFAEDLYEYEYDHVFIGEYDGPYTANLEEVEELRWVGVSDLRRDLVENPEKYTPWFLICAPKVLDTISCIVREN